MLAWFFCTPSNLFISDFHDKQKYHRLLNCEDFLDLHCTYVLNNFCRNSPKRPRWMHFNRKKTTFQHNTNFKHLFSALSSTTWILPVILSVRFLPGSKATWLLYNFAHVFDIFFHEKRGVFKQKPLCTYLKFHFTPSWFGWRLWKSEFQSAKVGSLLWSACPLLAAMAARENRGWRLPYLRSKQKKKGSHLSNPSFQKGNVASLTVPEHVVMATDL